MSVSDCPPNKHFPSPSDEAIPDDPISIAERLVRAGIPLVPMDWRYWIVHRDHRDMIERPATGLEDLGPWNEGPRLQFGVKLHHSGIVAIIMKEDPYSGLPECPATPTFVRSPFTLCAERLVFLLFRGPGVPSRMVNPFKLTIPFVDWFGYVLPIPPSVFQLSERAERISFEWISSLEPWSVRPARLPKWISSHIRPLTGTEIRERAKIDARIRLEKIEFATKDMTGREKHELLKRLREGRH